MKSDIEKTIPARVAPALGDVVPASGRSASEQILKCAKDLVRAVWIGKIYAGLPKDKTTIPEYFLDAELKGFLNEAIEECHKRICSLAEHSIKEFS